MAVLYWIKLPEHDDMLTQGYIGATTNLVKRLKSHKHRFKEIWDKIIVKTILMADIDYCYMIEQKLRPMRNIGWNKSIGGYRNNKMIGEENPNFAKFGESAPYFQGWWITPLGKFAAAREAAKAHQISTTTIERKCRGRFVKDKFYPPKDGYAFEQKSRVAS